MDVQTRLAQYRTLLAEKRTNLAQLQLGAILVTLSIAGHAGLVLFHDGRPGPSWWGASLVLVAVFAAGAALAAHAARALWRTERTLANLRRALNVTGWGTGLLTTPDVPLDDRGRASPEHGSAHQSH